jgi:CDP-glucose 4,6-dehydratase
MVGLASADGWHDKRVLVTGATGMLGAWVCRGLLEAGAQVIALVRDFDQRTELFRSELYSRVALVYGTVEDFWTIERAINQHEADTVIHLAAQTIVGAANRFPLQTYETNIGGTYRLLEACRLHAGLVKRIVVASSDKAYGDHAGVAYTEDTPLDPRHPYDVSKGCVDLLCRSYAVTYALPCVVVRCSNLYGEGDLNWSRIVPGVIRALLHLQRPVLRGDGTNARDYLYVRDAASAYLALALNADRHGVRGEAFNVSSERTTTTLELVARIAELMHVADVKPIIQSSAVHEIPNQAVCSQKIRQQLGWQPGYNLTEGLGETIGWYKRYFGVTVD